MNGVFLTGASGIEYFYTPYPFAETRWHPDPANYAFGFQGDGGAWPGVADVLDVGRAEALLDGRGPGPRRLLLAEHVGLELHHARRGEQQRRVVGDEAGGRQRGVPLALEEPEEGAS